MPIPKNEERWQALAELLPAIKECDKFVASRWRVHETLLRQFQDFHLHFQSQQIYSHLIPLLLRLINQNSAFTVKQLAVKQLCRFVRNNRKLEQRLSLTQKMVDDYGRGRSYWDRLGFIDICVTMERMFSRRFFKDYLYLPLLDLARDPVMNVRMKLCSTLPSLKRLLKLPADSNLLNKLQQALEHLLEQDDPDVVDAAERAQAELDAIIVPEVKEGAGAGMQTEEDFADQQKEEEEKQLLMLEEQDAAAERSKEDERVRNKWAAMERGDATKKLTPSEMDKILRGKHKKAPPGGGRTGGKLSVTSDGGRSNQNLTSKSTQNLTGKSNQNLAGKPRRGSGPGRLPDIGGASGGKGGSKGGGAPGRKTTNPKTSNPNLKGSKGSTGSGKSLPSVR